MKGGPTSVNAERNIHTLNNFLRPQLRRWGLHRNENVYFQLKCATPHTAPLSTASDYRLLPWKLILCSGDKPYPPSTSHWTTCDLCCGSSSNHEFTTTNLRILDDLGLGVAISNQVAAIDFLKMIKITFNKKWTTPIWHYFS